MKVVDTDAQVVNIGARRTQMDPTHPQWEEFLGRLEGKDGVNVTKDKDDSVTWECEHSWDLIETILIGDMGFNNDFVEESIEFFTVRGASCDCEVLFNAETKFN